jgi:iron complex transport system ATP-binding protein
MSAGEGVALLGENGSGKSTLLRLLAGLIASPSGEIELDARPLSEWPRKSAARTIGYLPQSFEPLFPVSALEMVLLGRTARLGMFAAPAPADVAAAHRALDQVDAGGFADRDIREMSGGERQRVFLARVLAGEPEILLLDEPTAGLDPRHRLLVVRVIKEFVRNGGLAVFATHELDVAAAAANQVVLLREGCLAASGEIGATMTPETLTEVYGVPASVRKTESGHVVVSLGINEPG